MLKIVDILHTFREEHLKCPVCKEHLQGREVQQLRTCGHFFCTPCTDSLGREDGNVICCVCEKHQSEDDIIPANNTFGITKQSFGELVKAVRGYFLYEGDEDAMNALISKVCMTMEEQNKRSSSSTVKEENVMPNTLVSKTAERRNKRTLSSTVRKENETPNTLITETMERRNKGTPSSTARKENVIPNALISKATERHNKRNPSSTRRKENIMPQRRSKRINIKVQEEKRETESDNEPFEKGISSGVGVGRNCASTSDESPDVCSVKTSHGSTESVASEISISARKDDDSILSDDGSSKQYNISPNTSESNILFSGDKNSIRTETLDDSDTCSESDLQSSTIADTITTDGLRTSTPVPVTENRRSKTRPSLLDNNSVCVEKTLNSSSIKCSSTKRKLARSNVSKDPVLNDISNVLSNTSDTRLRKKKKMEIVNSAGSKLDKNVDMLKALSSTADKNRENCVLSDIYMKKIQDTEAADSVEVETLKPRHGDNSPYSKCDVKRRKKLSLSRRLDFDNLQKEKTLNSISSPAEDGRERLTDLLNTKQKDDIENKMLQLVENENVDKVTDDTNRMDKTAEETSNYSQEVCNKTDDISGRDMKDDLMNVGSQNSSGVNTVDDYNEKGAPDIADLNNSVSRFSEETCQGKIIDHNRSVEANEQLLQQETPNLDERESECDETLKSATESKDRTVLSSSIKLNCSIEIENNFIQNRITETRSFRPGNNSYHLITQEDTSEKRMESISMSNKGVADDDDLDIVESTPTDIMSSSPGGLLSSSVLKSNTCFGRQNLQNFNIVTSLIEKDEDFVTVCKFTDRFSGTFSGRKSSVTMDTTHLIMKTSNNNRVHQTFKYLQAVVLHIPVVSFEWIQQSLKCGWPLPVEDFLVHGENGENAVELSLLNPEESIFQNFAILVLDPLLSGLRSCRIEDLLITGGAYVVKEDVLRKVPRSLFKIVLTDEEITENVCREHCMKYSAITLPVTWAFDSIAEYRIAPWQKYVSREIRKMILFEFNVIRGPLYTSSDEEED